MLDFAEFCCVIVISVHKSSGMVKIHYCSSHSLVMLKQFKIWQYFCTLWYSDVAGFYRAVCNADAV